MQMKSCLRQIQNVRVVHSFGTPRMENCLQYSVSTIHTCMEVEPPIHRTASKVYLCNLKYLVYLSIHAFIARSSSAPYQVHIN